MGEALKISTAIIDLANQRDVDGMDRYLSDGLRFVNPITGPTDKTGMNGFFSAIFAAFPNIDYRIDRQIEEGDTAILECTVTGKNTGPFMGQAPSGNAIQVPVAFIVDVTDGKVREWHSYFDAAKLQRQLSGAAAAAEAARV
ncbi:MAG: ester cyclase [Candidatus Limnocylindria bacterium]